MQATRIIRIDTLGGLIDTRHARRIDGGKALLVTGRPAAYDNVQHYVTGAEFRPRSEVTSPAAFATSEGVPLTIGHPGIVTNENVGRLAVGYMRNTRDGNDGMLTAELVITDARAIDAVMAGALVELSAGYEVDLDPIGGEYMGQSYVAIQRKIRWNHLALLSAGQARAGRGARIQ